MMFVPSAIAESVTGCPLPLTYTVLTPTFTVTDAPAALVAVIAEPLTAVTFKIDGA